MTKEIEVVCIDDSSCGEWLTYGEKYKAWDDSNDEFNYSVRNNCGYTSNYRKTRFMDAAIWEKAQWRNQQIDKILDDI
jgi:hypothetical protein